jgi:2,4-dienoyl-CoA reductase-like NADH-dependent reductase (Old Yellow Enzyme family)
MLFTPGQIGSLLLHNRLVRSATAERMAKENGAPRRALKELYRTLTEGDVGLIITGHMYIADRGKCHREMTGIQDDDLIPSLKELTDAVHALDGKIAVQINHGGGNCSPETVSDPLAPSPQGEPFFKQQAQEMTGEEIEQTIQAYAQAARRAVEADFDALQLHGAHGYLISQFLSPLSNHRQDQWGGSIENRSRFLQHICRAVRQEVGPDYPLLIKFGLADGPEGGLSLEEGGEIASRFQNWGLDGVEISVGFGGGRYKGISKGITKPEDEAYLLPLVKKARENTELPLIAVGGFRSRKVMEQVLVGGWADFISLSRPLIREPHLPKRMKTGEQSKAKCISSNNCWPEKKGEGIGCKCPPLPDE